MKRGRSSYDTDIVDDVDDDAAGADDGFDLPDIGSLGIRGRPKHRPDKLDDGPVKRPDKKRQAQTYAAENPIEVLRVQAHRADALRTDPEAEKERVRQARIKRFSPAASSGGGVKSRLSRNRKPQARSVKGRSSRKTRVRSRGARSPVARERSLRSPRFKRK
jgi:hypothetical protein